MLIEVVLARKRRRFVDLANCAAPVDVIVRRGGIIRPIIAHSFAKEKMKPFASRNNDTMIDCDRKSRRLCFEPTGAVKCNCCLISIRTFRFQI